MVRITQIALISTVVLAVLAFGGTEPLFFSVVRILLLGMGIPLIVAYATPRVGKPRLPLAIPIFLVALVLLQIVPFPTSVVQLMRAAGDLPVGASLATINIAPYETLSHLLLLLT